MDNITRAVRHLTSLIAAERDARKQDVREIRGHLKAIDARLENIDQRMAEGDERTGGFEAAIIDGLWAFQAAVTSNQESVEERLSALEQWRKDQAG